MTERETKTIATSIRRGLAPLFRFRALGLLAERLFWWRWIRSGGLSWPEDFRARLNPERPLASYLLPLIEPLRSPVRILDVGSGPVTIIGYRAPGKQLEITASDVLAPQYDAMMRRRNIEPPVRTVYADAERLAERFGENSFDLVHAINTLDHMSDPMRAIQEMVRVARPGRHVVLVHTIDEAESQNYIGLHQWNLSERDGEFVIWKPGQTTIVSSVLGPACTVGVRREQDTLYVDIHRLR